MYIDYTYYQNNGGRADIDRATFDRLCYKAQKRIDTVTQGRIGTMQIVPEAVKRLIIELIALQYESDNAISSYTNDGYSETYAEPLTAEVLNKKCGAIISEYLSLETNDKGVPLLYRGIV